MLVAVIAMAANLRPAVNAVGAVLPELRADTGLSGAMAGLLLALPPLAFALVGIGTARISRQFGPHRTALLALGAMAVGQVVRAAVPATWALFAGSLLALAGIAIGNVILPGLVRLHFPSAIGPATALYTTTLTLWGAIGSGVTLPIERALGGNWRLGLGMWAATAVIALIPWFAAALRHPRAAQLSGPTEGLGPLMLLRSRRAWSMAVFFGVQSMQAYVVFGWLTGILTDAGISDQAAGGALAITVGVGFPIAAVVPAVLHRIRRPGGLVVAFVLCHTTGYLGLIFFPAAVPWLLALLIGVGIGSFPLALTLVTLRSRTSSGTTALSAFSQSIGYLIASIGPVGFGVLQDLSRGWVVPLVAQIATLAVMLGSGLAAVRDWVIEDHLPPRRLGAARG